MEYNPIHLEKFLKGYHTLSPTATELQAFGADLLKIFQIPENESEEHQKNVLSPLLAKSFGYQCNTKGRIDLVIYQEGQARVLFECKRLSEKSEFVKNKNNLDSKAFYESILYYLREFFTYENNNLTFIILTNTRDFYLIDAKEYLVFTKNKAIKKAFDNCEKKQGNDTSTTKFYNEAKEILQKLDHTFTYTHFTLTSDLSESALAQIYQAFSPKVLLKAISYIDANTLNQAFYDELLYILGLHEIVEGSKVLIRPSSTPNTLLDSLCKAYGFDPTSDFESIFALLTTWNNRILFLRLLESMLLSFKHIDTPFLHIERIGDFPTLNTLFFEVLAKKEKERSNIPHFLESIPYLNSSLFDRNALELDGKEIKLLDSRPLELYPHSILHKDEAFKRDYKDQKSLPLLEYLFAFLRAYDFTTIPSDIKDNIKINQNKLINSAVLGLVFEKLNGYKEGSFYTPSFITNYMCKQSLEKVVIDKFNQAQSWECKDLESLKSKIDKLTDSQDGYKQANAIFDSIKICDPSVGSGHFLVSVLNWLIYLKFKLRILCDENYERLKDITLEIQNDEILIRDSQNKIFSYALPAHDQIESHKLQKALFQAKRKLIESCLFGVDINPNSCEITKLRLWIELLKFSYYKDIEQKYLETLPNIDINIKCGNSLVSNIALDMTKESLTKELKSAINKGARLEMQEEFATMSNALNKLPERIEKYKNAVNAYKNETNSDLKKIHQSEITKSKDFIIKIFHTMSAEYRVFKSLLASYLRNYGYPGIDNAKINGEPLDPSLKDALNNYITAFQLHKYLDIPKESRGSATQELLALIDSMYRYENLLSDRSAFEWRFEFPEVLNSNGDFMGFDLVIGNPPYIKEADNKKLFERTKSLRTYQGKMDIWYHFVGRGFDILRNKGILTFIATNNWTTNTGAKKLRNIILQESQIINLLDFGAYMCFDSASIQTMVMEFQKSDSVPSSYEIRYARIDSKKPTDEHRDAILDHQNFNDIIYLTPTIYPQSFLNQPLSFADSEQERVLQKILAGGSMFLEEDEVWQGLVHPQPYLDKNMLAKFRLMNKDCDLQVGDGIFNLSSKEIKVLGLTKNEKKLLKPYYEANKLLKYYGEQATDIYVIYTGSKFNKADSMDKYPNLKNHLDRFQNVITSCNKPYGLHRARKQSIFEGEKVLSRVKCVDYPIFTYVDFDCYVGLNFNIIKTNRIDTKLLTGILNSRLIAFWLRHKGKMQGSHYQVNQEPLLNIPIVKPDSKNKKLTDKVIALVDHILESKAKDPEADIAKLESEIDSLVYELYGLEDSEIKIIEGR